MSYLCPCWYGRFLLKYCHYYINLRYAHLFEVWYTQRMGRWAFLFYVSCKQIRERRFRVYLLLLVFLGQCVERLMYTYDLVLLAIPLLYLIEILSLFILDLLAAPYTSIAYCTLEWIHAKYIILVKECDIVFPYMIKYSKIFQQWIANCIYLIFPC